jgi:hypothetical protein
MLETSHFLQYCSSLWSESWLFDLNQSDHTVDINKPMRGACSTYLQTWTVTSRGNFFSKWATSRGHFQRVTARGHFLVTSRGQKCPLFGWILVDIFWVNSSGHFLQYCSSLWSESWLFDLNQSDHTVDINKPRLSKHCSVTG